MSTGTGHEMFEAAVERALGPRLRPDEEACAALWSALANVEWGRADGGAVSCTLRRASELDAEIRGRGHRLEWYCSGPYATVSGGIEEAMAREGWAPRPTTR